MCVAQFWHSVEVGVAVEVGRKGILFNGGDVPIISPGRVYTIPSNTFCTYYIIRGMLWADNLFRDTGRSGVQVWRHI